MIVDLSINKLKSRCNPFSNPCWAGLDRPLTTKEICKAIENNHLVAPHAQSPGIRSKHIGRIAWFVAFGWKNPIGVDVGIPSLGCCPEWPVIDGNHRFAAAIYRKDKIILSNVTGATSEIETLLVGKQP